MGQGYCWPFVFHKSDFSRRGARVATALQRDTQTLATILHVDDSARGLLHGARFAANLATMWQAASKNEKCIQLNSEFGVFGLSGLLACFEENSSFSFMKS